MTPRRRVPAFDPIAEAARQWRAHRFGAVAHMEAATSLMRAQQLVIGRVDEVLRPFGLTFARYEALTLLFFSRKGALPLGKMGVRLMVHPASVTNAIDRLEADGLVRRASDPADRRTVLAEITAAGRAVVEAATQALVEAQFGLAELSSTEATALTEVVRALRRRAGDFAEQTPEAAAGAEETVGPQIVG
jgi:DNA-binding MarR family transcriptional regulator